MEENQGYVIRQSVLFENNRGFALGENFKAPNPFVTWQFTLEDGQRDPAACGHRHLPSAKGQSSCGSSELWGAPACGG